MRAIPVARMTLALAVVAATAACSTTSGGDAAEGGKAGGTLTVASPYPTQSLDPHGAAGAATGTQIAGQAIFSRLVRAKPDGEMIGDFATKWDVDPQATTWTFTLRDGVTFSDGSAADSADVVASIKRVVDLKGPNAANFTGIDAKADGPGKVVLSTAKPDPALLGKLTLLFITPSDVTEQSFTKPVGSGPFRVDSFTPGQTLELLPNPDYYGGAPKLDKLVMRVIPEVSARMTALKTGEIQATWGIPDDQVAQLQGDDGLTVQSVPATSVYTMWFNSGVPALAKPEVRRALWQAVDFDTIVTSLYPQTGEVSKSVLAPAVLGYSALEPPKYDAAAAKAALQAAGFDFSTKLRLQFSGADYRQFIQAVVADLNKIGVKAEAAEKESAVFLEDLLAMRWDINFQSLSTPTFDAATNLGRLYTCAAKRNGYCNPQLDTVLNEAGSISDANKRKELYAQASQIIWSDAVGMYPMSLKIAYAWRSEVHGLEPNPSYLPDFSTVTLS
ncbi:ABC transporter substrate-binding protein [Asanoa iriomotensis]|uniref:ABC transporter substrate-binding protein n=1 Tax=Asanoa iriomotensis TaxID=234613 RepID=A0ABQ4BZT9_9ACTN|nr:ABC transporter substrate-binding protein [Asanoa iriomotensis]GIF56048.1 ABC transporter substrate-binding protein [Asanoa iriomotensis]